MFRMMMNDLKKWKKSKYRKPLLLEGARQVGKTWIVKEFGKDYFDDAVYINFDVEKGFHDLLEKDIRPESIISAISLITGKKIIPESTLIIFDEVQEEPRALTALKYFCEEAPEYAVIATGSFMGIALHKGTSFPVGKVDHLKLYPLTYREFLIASGKENLNDILESADQKQISGFRSYFIQALREYYFVGGMPEAVETFIDEKDYRAVRDVQNMILEYYRQDFSKHADPRLTVRLYQVWDSIPSQLAKENRKFIYGNISKGARAKDFELALVWLSDCGLIHMVHRIKKPGIPLKGYEDLSSFKIYMNDVGLLGAMGGVNAKDILDKNVLFTEFKGALTEQYVLQQMISDMGIFPGYYSAENSRGEIDFLIQRDGIPVPIEVKAEENLRAKSLKAFVEKYDLEYGVRISMSDYRRQDWLENLPLYSFMAAFNNRNI